MTSPTNDEKLFNCPVLAALKVISGKWKTRILWLLRGRPTHFGALKRALPGVPSKVLTEQLQQLEADGILTKHPNIRDMCCPHDL